MFLKKYLTEILLGVIIVMIFGIYFFIGYNFFYKKDDSITQNIIEPKIVKSEENEQVKMVNVEVKGAVNNPGVYSLTENSIINDVVNLSGGFIKEAYTNNINLSKKVSDELLLYVFTNYEYYKLNKEAEVKTVECNCPEVDVTPCLEKGASIIENNNAVLENNENDSSLININTAGEELLTTLSGIGESKAKSIIDYRTQNGNFLSIEDIKNVSGISDKTFESIKEFITV